MLEVVGHRQGAGGEGGLHPGLDLEPLLHRFLRHQPGGEHHRGVGGVGAGGDGGDHHLAVLQLHPFSVDLRLHRSASGDASLFFQRLQIGFKPRLGVAQLDAVLGPLGAGDAGHDGGEIQLQGLGVVRHPAVVAPHPLGLGVGFHQGHLLLAATGEAQVVQSLFVDGEETAGGAVLGAHVGDGGAVSHGQVAQGLAVELHELAHHAMLAQPLDDGEHQVGGGGPLGQFAGEPHAHHLGNEHGDGLPQHGGLRLDAAHAPAQHPQAVDHGGMGVGAHHGVGIGAAHAVVLLVEDHAGEILHVHLVDDAGVGRHHFEVGEGLLAPFEELVALAVAVEFDLGVEVGGVGGAEAVHLHRVVDHQLGRLQGVDAIGIAAQFGDGVAHGGQIHHGGHPREILHQHPRRAVLDLLVGFGLGVPGGQRLDVGAGHGDAVLVAQQVLQEDLGGEGQAIRALHGIQAEDLVGLAVHLQGVTGVETVGHGSGPLARVENQPRILPREGAWAG